jgi:hypothetical protein
LKKLEVEEEEEEGVQEDGKGPQQRSRKGGAKGGSGGGVEGDEEDLEQFMQEIDADKEMRRNINIYKKRVAVPAPPDASKGDAADRHWDEEEVFLVQYFMH